MEMPLCTPECTSLESAECAKMVHVPTQALVLFLGAQSYCTAVTGLICNGNRRDVTTGVLSPMVHLSVLST